MTALNDRRIRAEAAAELARRKRAGVSLHTFGQSIQIPTVVGEPLKPDETICPAEYLYTIHHRVIIAAIERTINRPFGRLLIMAPPGSAKSSYASVVLPPYVMGREPKFPLILASYASELAWKQSKRAMQIADSADYREVAWEQKYSEPLVLDRKAAADWSLNNGSSMVAAGLTAGLTGNRAGGWIIDDPVAGREEADSPAVRKKIWDAYNDDLLTRVKPSAWGILIMTRWHEDDLAGKILPTDYKGQSGMIRCRDGLDWEVLNIPARAERTDDPLGRQFGEYMWPEWFPPRHWQIFENAGGSDGQRTWTSLYQQRPTPQGAGQFNREMFNRFTPDQLPMRLAMIGASDCAVTKGGGDFTEHGVCGLDASSNIWFTDWWYGQKTTDVWIDQLMKMVQRWHTPIWFNEGGVIDKATRPAIMKAMRETKPNPTFFDLRSLPSMQDKVAKVQSFQARAAGGSVWMPVGAKWDRVIDQLIALPAGRYDDAADVCGLIGRAIDQLPVARPPASPRDPGLIPFTGAWVEHEEKPDVEVRYV